MAIKAIPTKKLKSAFSYGNSPDRWGCSRYHQRKEEVYTTGRELSRSELRDIRHLVTTMCANYDSHYKECLPLDGACYMFCIAYTNSPLCKYFRNAVLPLSPELEAVFSDGGKSALKECKFCGGGFVPTGRQAYCSEGCEQKGRRRDTAERTRRYRQKSEPRCDD